jgi:hypothetical protein
MKWAVSVAETDAASEAFAVSIFATFFPKMENCSENGKVVNPNIF